MVIRRPNGPRWSGPRSLPQPDEVVRPVAARILALARVPALMVGRTYMEDTLCALALVYPNRPPLTTEIYPLVAARHGVTAGSVEAGIRHAIMSAIRDYGGAASSVLGSGKGRSNARAMYTLLALIQADLTQGAAP